ncbi:MAG: YceI family protein [Flavobacteriales bacterium]|nr:YceI family protein [Flavobacteriales bacterium]
MEMSYTLDPAASTVAWTGTMLGIKSHTGNLNFIDGTLTTKGPSLTGGTFTVDMKNYAMTDTNYAPDGSEKGTRAMLMGHLTSPDFFDVASFPTATLKITAVNGSTATADLTLRGKTNSETITDIVVTPNADGSVKASGKLTFDRQKYGVAWSSGSKDAVLNDNIETTVDITAKAAM